MHTGVLSFDVSHTREYRETHEGQSWRGGGCKPGATVGCCCYSEGACTQPHHVPASTALSYPVNSAEK